VAERKAARPQLTKAQVVALRIGSLLPLVALGVAYAASPSFRGMMNEGVRLLVAGDKDGLRAWGERIGPWAALSTTVLMIVQALAAPIPAFVVTAANSLMFGALAGGILSVTSATIAGGLCFLLARAWGEPLVARLVPERSLARANQFMRRHGTSTVLIARLMPLVPFDPISYLAGLSPMRFDRFMWATFVGQIPTGMAYSYLAQEIDRPTRMLVLTAATVAALAIFGVLVWKWTEHRRQAKG
jgi:uncharacterized membrane protein YdjX (TVP38/TMEM64 family)